MGFDVAKDGKLVQNVPGNFRTIGAIWTVALKTLCVGPMGIRNIGLRKWTRVLTTSLLDKGHAFGAELEIGPKAPGKT